MCTVPETLMSYDFQNKALYLKRPDSSEHTGALVYRSLIRVSTRCVGVTRCAARCATRCIDATCCLNLLSEIFSHM